MFTKQKQNYKIFYPQIESITSLSETSHYNSLGYLNRFNLLSHNGSILWQGKKDSWCI